MFSGIIKKTSTVKKTNTENEILSVGILLPKKWKVILGESISINGVCSTVVKKSVKDFYVEYMPETLRKTNVALLKEGDELNLEKSLRVGDPLDAHFVTGHIDTVGVVKKIKIEGDSRVFEVSLPKEFFTYVVHKGSITIDGVGLTVSKKNRQSIEVSLIPYTLKQTNLHKRIEGDRVNVEMDILGKFILQSQSKRSKI